MYRQGVLSFHTHWPTRKWWHRLFSTLLGIMITDAYYMYRYDVKDFAAEDNIMTYIKFVDTLACQLIHLKRPVNGMNDANNQMVIPAVYQV